MVSTVILTHGGLADELVAAAGVIMGDTQGLTAVSLEWTDSIEEASEKLRRALARIDAPNEVLILTDIHGGTPYNVAASFHSPGRVEVVTGVNLPMVVRLGCPGMLEMDVAALAELIQKKARSSIRLARSNGAPDPNGATE